ncbi:MAG: EAL domain-containing protein [Xanthobacteraceae bacterium]
MIDLAGELPRALEQDEIVPYYQPLVDLQTGHVIGFEVLARWHHPIHQVIYPADFISLAEHSGLIGALTERLLRRACLEAFDWPSETTLSVNLSPLQLRDSAMPERLHKLVEQAGFPFHRLTFEITEGAIIQDFDLARATVGNLKSLGAHLALDDFGTGFSGLRHLQMLPFDMLKLDAAFVRTMTGHRETRKIVAAVMGLCQCLGLTAIAEGIESQDQLEMLRSLGYPTGQGWLFGRPAPAAQASAMLAYAREQQPDQSVAHIAEQVALRLEALPIQCLWQLRALYEGAPVGLAFVDHNFRYLAVNERLAEMHGLPIAALLGRPVGEVIPDRIEQVEPRVRRALAGEVVKDVRTRYRQNDGRVVVLQSSYQPVRDGTGEIVGVSVAVVDITGEPQVPQRLELPVFQPARP